MKLIRINPDHFIIADDLEIKVGDVVVEKLTTAEYEIFEIHTLNDIDVTSQKLVTYSTQPLYYDRIKTLDLSEVKELIDNNKEKEYTKENLIKAILLWDNHINIKEEDIQRYLHSTNQALRERSPFLFSASDCANGSCNRKTQKK
jgi:hypothetical protein